MRFISWNVNGIRAVLQKNFEEVFDSFAADVFALQETKCQTGQVELELPGYHQYWSYAQRKGYSGTAVFSREEPSRVLHELGFEHLDTEGRICALELEDLWFVDAYIPNAQPELARINHRLEFNDAFRDFCKGLEQGILPSGESIQSKPVVMTGDFNVAHNEIDLKHPARNRGNAGFSDEERTAFQQLLDAGFVDTFRLLYPTLPDMYTWWSYKAGARKNNSGWRIDYFLVSESLKDKVEAASIFSEVMGSDHCPIGLELRLPA